MGEEAYPTLNYFVKECLPDIGSMRAYDPFLLMEYLGIIILDRLTLSDVELAAHNYIQTLRYERTRSLRDGTVCHYGIQLVNREHRKLILEDRIVDICTDGKQVSELADLMTKKASASLPLPRGRGGFLSKQLFSAQDAVGNIEKGSRSFTGRELVHFKGLDDFPVAEAY